MLLFEGRQWTWRQVVAEAELRAELLTSLRRDGRSTWASCSRTRPSTCSCWPERPWPVRWSSESIPPVGVPSWPPTSGAADCQLLVTDSTQVELVDQLDLGLAPGGLLVVDEDAYAHMLAGLRDSGDEARPQLPEPTPDQLYLLIFTSGSTGGPKAVRMTQGRASRAAARDRIQLRRRPLLGHAPVPRQRPVGRRAPRPRQRGHAGPAPEVLGLQLPPRRAAVRGHLLQHRGPGHRPHRGHPADRARPPPPAPLRARARRPRPRTRRPSPSGSASRWWRGTDRARTPSC